MLLAHERLGHGAPLVLVHGLGSARTVWRPIVPALAAAFDVIAVDLPGHGETGFVDGAPMHPRALADSVLETLDHCGVERAHLLGNSLGGWIALELAASRPDRVVSVTALAPAGMRREPLSKISVSFKLNRYLAVAARPLLPFILRSERLRGLGFAHNSPVWQSWSVETCRDAAEAMASSRGYADALNATLGRVADCTLRIPLEIPVTVVFGDEDRILPPTTSQSRQYLPEHARWISLDRCGHAPQLDHPGHVVALMREIRPRE